MKNFKKASLIFFAGLLLLPFQTQASFSDLESDHPFKTAIEYLQENEVIAGYPDGTFQAERAVNRAEFIKIVVGASIGIDPEESAANCFPDVKASDWFSSYVCYAKTNGIIGGYPDGTFKPAESINLVEALKVLTLTLEVETSPPKGENWYSKYLEAMSKEGYIPQTFNFLTQEVNRGEMSEMTWRILEQISDKPNVSANKLENPCYPLGEDLPDNIDMNQVRATWLGWYNDGRSEDGLYAYTYNPQLNRTATNWSELAKDRGYLDHKRPGTTEYYDYWAITDWFKNLGLEFKNVYRVTHTENIGWGPYDCNQADCTQVLLDAMRYNFDLYMAEKDKDYKPHYQSVMNKYFKEIGLGVSVDEAAKKMYMTIHYGTEITSNPYPVCEG